MSRQNIILLVSILIILVIFVGFYFYKKNKNSYTPPVVEQTPLEKKEAAEREELKKINTSVKPVEPKQEEKMRDQLEEFEPAPSVKTLSEEDMRKALLELNSPSNP
jgi:uncharacterized protein YxeA